MEKFKDISLIKRVLGISEDKGLNEQKFPKPAQTVGRPLEPPAPLTTSRSLLEMDDFPHIHGPASVGQILKLYCQHVLGEVAKLRKKYGPAMTGGFLIWNGTVGHISKGSVLVGSGQVFGGSFLLRWWFIDQLNDPWRLGWLLAWQWMLLQIELVQMMANDKPVPANDGTVWEIVWNWLTFLSTESNHLLAFLAVATLFWSAYSAIEGDQPQPQDQADDIESDDYYLCYSDASKKDENKTSPVPNVTVNEESDVQVREQIFKDYDEESDGFGVRCLSRTRYHSSVSAVTAASQSDG